MKAVRYSIRFVDHRGRVMRSGIYELTHPFPNAIEDGGQRFEYVGTDDGIPVYRIVEALAVNGHA